MSLAPLLMAMERYIKQRTPTWVLGATVAAQTDDGLGVKLQRAGEMLTDGSKWVTLQTFQSAILDAQGGPGKGDLVLGVKMPGGGIGVVLGKVLRKGDPVSSICPLVLVCDPPLGKPVGNIGLGPWASKTVAPPGYSVSDGGMLNPHAHLVMTLDENDKADAIFIAARAADGTITYPYNLIPDWSITDASGAKPVMSEIMGGSVWADGGFKGLVTDGHDPTDADIVGIAAGTDGVTAVRHDFSHSRHFTRMGDTWIAQANLIFFSGTDSTGLTYNPAVGDFGFGTDGSLWLCTAATAAPGTWTRQYPPVAVCAQVSTTSGGTMTASPWSISWGSVDKNSGMTVNLGTDPTKITAAQAGTYVVTADILLDTILPSGGEQFYDVYLHKNGVAVRHSEKYIDDTDGSGAGSIEPRVTVSVSSLVDLAIGDYLEIVIVYSGGATTAAVDIDSRMLAHRI